MTQWFNGDGNISAFRIHNGRVHFKQRYVRTEKFVREREAGRALLGQQSTPTVLCHMRLTNRRQVS